jgi:hypothetical protein
VQVVIVSTVRSSRDLQNTETDKRHGLGFMFDGSRCVSVSIPCAVIIVTVVLCAFIDGHKMACTQLGPRVLTADITRLFVHQGQSSL